MKQPSQKPTASTFKNQLNPLIYDKLMQSEDQLTQYLKYLRYKQPVPRIQLTPIHYSTFSSTSKSNNNYQRSSKQSMNSTMNRKTRSVKQCEYVLPYLKKYFELLKDISSNMENSMSKKILKKTLQFLEEFPSLHFLVQVVNCFGREKKKLCLNEAFIEQKVCDDMIPLFEKIIEKVEYLRRESEGKKLSQLGHRIEHLHILINSTKDRVEKNEENAKIFRTFEADRIDKYLVMEENISKAQNNYGSFSKNFLKNREVFSNINKVYLQIRNSSAAD